MSYTTVAQTLIDAEAIRNASMVRIMGETSNEVMYSKSVYDACREAAGTDDDLFQIVLLMYTGNMDRSFVWARNKLSS